MERQILAFIKLTVNSFAKWIRFIISRRRVEDCSGSPLLTANIEHTSIGHERIYCIGDSHVGFFSGQDHIQPNWPNRSDDLLPYFKTFRLGAILAYSLLDYGSTYKGRELLSVLLDRGIPAPERQIPPKSTLLLCFGEIDCRAHLLKQAKIQNRSISSVVIDCVERYGSVISEVVDLGYKVLVWNVIPSTRYEISDGDFPTIGTCIERNQISRLFNNHLETLCATSGAKLISIFDDLVDEQGLTKMEYYSDRVHLSQKAMGLALAKIREVTESSHITHEV